MKKNTRSRLLSCIFWMALLVLPGTAMAQNEANIWYFGSKAGLDFNSGTPVALTDSAMTTNEGCATFSDSNGNLLFYTDGITVYNRNHQVMINGSGLNGDNSSSQSAVAVPVIGNSDRFYLFTVDQGTGTAGVSYSVVDMSLGAGLGAVTLKNTPLNTEINTEKVAIAQHANGIDFWVLTSKSDGTYYAYRVTPTGINPVPVTSSTGLIRNNVEVGYMRVSPDNQSIVATYFKSNKLDFLSFDNNTGAITLRARQTGLQQPYGVEFSPNNQFAYVSFTSGSEIRQYDLSASDAALPTSFTVITNSVPNVGALSIGPDRKLYVSIRFRAFLSTIDSPDLAGAAANFQLDSIDLNGRAAQFGLPTFANFIVAPPQVAITTPADGTSTNDTTPTVSGTAGTTNTVTVTIEDSNGTTLETRMLVALANNTWGFDAAALADGTYVIRATARNLNGDSVDAPPSTFTVDTVTPTLTIDTPVDASTGNDDTPALTGSTEIGATVVLLIKDSNGATVETVTPVVDAQGNYNVDASALADGTYTIEGTSTDAAGNSVSAGPNTFTIDTVAPTVTLDTPADNTLTTDTTPTISGTSNAATVTLVIKDSNGATVETLTPPVDGQGDYSVDASALADGTYTVDATVTDAANNTVTAGPNSFTVDATAPTITITTPVNNAITSDTTPTISGSTEANATVSLILKDSNGAIVETFGPTVDAQGNFTIDAAALADGTYTIEGTSTDAANNQGTATVVTFTVDTVALTVSLLTPANGSSSSDTTPTISGTTKPGATITLVIKDSNGATAETLTPAVDAQGNFTVDAAALADGTYTVEATATNNANTATAGPNSFTIDTMAPAVTLTTPANATITNDTTPTISGSTDVGATISLEIKDSNGATVETLTPTVDAQGNFTADAAALADGDYSVEATASDAANNQAASGQNTFTIDTTAPAVAITAPADNTISNVRDVVISGTSDPNQEVVVVVVDANNAIVDTQTVNADANGDWTLTASNLANGGYTATATVTDAATNTANDETSFTVDSNQPTVAIDSPVDGSFTNDPDVALSGTTDADATLTAVLKDDQGAVVATDAVTQDNAGAWSTKASASLPDGTYTLEVTAMRNNGTSATATSTFTVDTVAPALTLDAPADGATVSEDKPTITGTSDAGQEVTVTIKDDQDVVIFEGIATTDANGDWSIEPTDALMDGDYTVEATALDEADNRASVGPNAFTVAKSVPMVSITSPEEAANVDTTTPVIEGTSDPGATISVLIDGVKAGETIADANGDWAFTTTTELDEGAHTVEATVTNDAGATASSGVVNFTVELPKTPIVITSPQEGDVIEGPTVTITGTGEPGEMLTITVDGKTETVTVDENGNWSVDVNTVESGQQTITVTAGEQSSTVTVTVNDAVTETLILEGGQACSSTNSSPTSSLWLLGLVGLLCLRRRKRA